jgi:hypothetical protein
MTVECTDCGGPVSRRFARVFGDESHNVHGCPACATFRELQNGAGAGVEIKPSV